MGNPNQKLSWTTLSATLGPAQNMSAASPDAAIAVGRASDGRRKSRIKFKFEWTPTVGSASLTIQPLTSISIAPTAADPNGFGDFDPPQTQSSKTGGAVTVDDQSFIKAATGKVGTYKAGKVVGNIILEVLDGYVKFLASDGGDGGTLDIYVDPEKP